MKAKKSKSHLLNVFQENNFWKVFQIQNYFPVSKVFVVKAVLYIDMRAI